MAYYGGGGGGPPHGHPGYGGHPGPAYGGPQYGGPQYGGYNGDYNHNGYQMEPSPLDPRLRQGMGPGPYPGPQQQPPYDQQYYQANYQYGAAPGQHPGNSTMSNSNPHINPRFLPGDKINSPSKILRNPYPGGEDSKGKPNPDVYDPSCPTISAADSDFDNQQINYPKSNSGPQHQQLMSQNSASTGVAMVPPPTTRLQQQQQQYPTHSINQLQQSQPVVGLAQTAQNETYPVPQHIPPSNDNFVNKTTITTTNSAAPTVKVMTGLVTQIQPGGFGMISEEIFFQQSAVTGSMPQVGDKVVVEAEPVEGMPFKYNAKRVTKLDMDLEEKNKTPSQAYPPFQLSPLPTLPNSLNLPKPNTSPAPAPLKSILKRNPPAPPVISKNGAKVIKPASNTGSTLKTTSSFSVDLDSGNIPRVLPPSGGPPIEFPEYTFVNDLIPLNPPSPRITRLLPGSPITNFNREAPPRQDLSPTMEEVLAAALRSGGNKKQRSRSPKRRSRSRSRSVSRSPKPRRAPRRSRSRSRSPPPRKRRSRSRSLSPRKSRRSRSTSPRKRRRSRSRSRTPSRIRRSRSRSRGRDRSRERKTSPHRRRTYRSKSAERRRSLSPRRSRRRSPSVSRDRNRTGSRRSTSRRRSSSGSPRRSKSPNDAFKLKVYGEVVSHGIVAKKVRSDLFPKLNVKGCDAQPELITRKCVAASELSKSTPVPIKFQIGNPTKPTIAKAGNNTAQSLNESKYPENNASNISNSSGQAKSKTKKAQEPAFKIIDIDSMQLVKKADSTPNSTAKEVQKPTQAKTDDKIKQWEAERVQMRSAGASAPTAVKAAQPPATSTAKSLTNPINIMQLKQNVQKDITELRHNSKPEPSRENYGYSINVEQMKQTVQRDLSKLKNSNSVQEVHFNSIPATKSDLDVQKIKESVNEGLKILRNQHEATFAKDKEGNTSSIKPTTVLSTTRAVTGTTVTVTIAGNAAGLKPDDKAKPTSAPHTSNNKDKPSEKSSASTAQLHQQQKDGKEKDKNLPRKDLDSQKPKPGSSKPNGKPEEPEFDEELERIQQQIHNQRFHEEEHRLKMHGDQLGLQNLYFMEDRRRRRLDERQLARLRMREIKLKEEKKYTELERLREEWGPPAQRIQHERELRERRMDEDRKAQARHNGQAEAIRKHEADYQQWLEDEARARRHEMRRANRGLEGRVLRRRTPSPDRQRGHGPPRHDGPYPGEWDERGPPPPPHFMDGPPEFFDGPPRGPPPRFFDDRERFEFEREMEHRARMEEEFMMRQHMEMEGRFPPPPHHHHGPGPPPPHDPRDFQYRRFPVPRR